jgi:lysophospholipase L1-like esterase
MSSRWLAAAVAVLALFTAGCRHAGAGASPGAGPPAAANLPSSMAALGDSVTAGFGSCIALDTCTRNSWSTGDGLRVNSHFQRIRAGNPEIRGHAYNLAVRGARAADLGRQAEAAVGRKVEYVTIMIGANDACRARVDDMTTTKRLRADVDRALGVLKKGLPKARVLVASVPDLYRVWQVGHTNSRAVRMWSHGVCPSLLAAATSDAAADVARREAVRERVAAYNRELAAACRAYGARCRYDGGAVHRVRFTLAMLNPLDFFHPDVDGQNKLADVTYPARFTW